MLSIEITLVTPEGRTLLGTAKIANDRTGSEEIGNYKYVLFKGDREWIGGRIEAFPRKLNCWDLLYRVLRSAVGRRNYK